MVRVRTSRRPVVAMPTAIINFSDISVSLRFNSNVFYAHARLRRDRIRRMVDQSSIRFFRSIRAMHTIYTKNPPPRHVNVHGALIGYSLIRSRNAPTATTLEINGEASPANIGNGLHPVVLGGTTSMATKTTSVTETMPYTVPASPIQRPRNTARAR